MHVEGGPRPRVNRTRGRRATDRLPTLESALVAGGIVAWSWCAYEVLRLVIR
jgi:hypothetical protein